MPQKAPLVLVEQYVDVDGIQTAYYQLNHGSPYVPGKGKPLLVIHGWGAEKTAAALYLFPKLAEYLGPKGYRPIALDLPGFGATPPLNGKVTIERLARFVERFADKLELGPCAVIGFSMGGTVALCLDYLAPKRVTHLVLQGTPIWWKLFPSFLRKLLKIAAALENPIAHRLLHWLFSIPFVAVLWEHLVDRDVRLGRMPKSYRRIMIQDARDTDIRTASDCAQDLLFRVDVRQTAENIRIPTLLIDGFDYNFSAISTTRILSDLIPPQYRRIVFIGRAAHLAPLVYPDLFSWQVAQWLLNPRVKNQK